VAEKLLEITKGKVKIENAGIFIKLILFKMVFI
jgi:hypothetical protein